MTATRVMIGIPKNAIPIFSHAEFPDVYKTGGGDDDFIQNGKSLAEESNYDFYVLMAHVVDKQGLVARLRQAYQRFFYVQMTE